MQGTRLPPKNHALGSAVGNGGDRQGCRASAGRVAAVALLRDDTPATDTIIPTQEGEADLFGLNAACQPDAEAEATLKLGEHRIPPPGTPEEFSFLDHPRGCNCIPSAMSWPAEYLQETSHPRVLAGTRTVLARIEDVESSWSPQAEAA